MAWPRPGYPVRGEPQVQATEVPLQLLMRVFFALRGPVGRCPGARADAARGQLPASPAPAAPAPAPAPDAARAPDLPATICGLTVPPPAKLPPASSPPVLYQIMPCFEKQGGFPVIEANTYLYYIELKAR